MTNDARDGMIIHRTLHTRLTRCIQARNMHHCQHHVHHDGNITRGEKAEVDKIHISNTRNLKRSGVAAQKGRKGF